jgi:amino-acid N-acetyltransferase
VAARETRVLYYGQKWRCDLVSIRPARSDEQELIRAQVRAERLIPFGLRWPRFLVAELAGEVAGFGQVKQHRDGSRELASLVVLPQHRGRGVGAALVQALLAQQPDQPIFLLCPAQRGSFYARFGFQPAGRAQLPPYFRRLRASSRSPCGCAGCAAGRAMP